MNLQADNQIESFTDEEIQKIYNHLSAIYYRSLTNGLVNIDSYDRQQLKLLLKIK